MRRCSGGFFLWSVLQYLKDEIVCISSGIQGTPFRDPKAPGTGARVVHSISDATIVNIHNRNAGEDSSLDVFVVFTFQLPLNINTEVQEPHERSL
jgi:hypothetical protein